jgi:hypothetical protein
MAWDGLIGELSNVLGLDAILDPGQDERQRALRNQEDATGMWMNQWNRTPTQSELFTPERMVRSGPSALSDEQLRGNAEYGAGRDAQMRALQQMQGVSEAGGYTPLERAQIAQAQRQAAQYEQQQRQAQLQQMEMRGLQGSGVEMASRIAAQQGGANRAAQGATDIATAAQQRALQAMQSGASTGNALQTSAQNRGAALDAFKQANTARGQQVNQRNTASRQQATRDAQQYRLDILAGATGQYNTNAAAANQHAQDQGSMISGLLGAIA